MSDATRVVLVTGAGRGTGLGIARVLASNGDSLVIADIDERGLADAETSVRGLGAADVLQSLTDVSDEAAVEAMVRAAHTTFGRIDAVVNTAAWIDPETAIVDMPTEVWRRSMSTNLDSVFYVTRAALKVMIPQRSGCLVNLASVNGTRGFPRRASYAASKAALINFTQTTAMEMLDLGIRANALVPGSIDGPRIRELRARRDTAGDLAPPGYEDLSPEWIGHFIDFLISHEGRFINGQAIPVGHSARSAAQSLF